MKVSVDTFEIRDRANAPPKVKAGTMIKVGCSGERFWCIVRQIAGDGQILASVDNQLIRLPWRCGDLLDLKSHNILETLENLESVHLSSSMNTFESISDAVIAWHSERLADGRAVSLKPHTVLVIPGLV